MSFFQIVFRQMRQRGLATALTMLTVALGVALAVAVLVVRRGATGLFGQGEFGYNVIVGAKGSPLQLVANTVYHLDRSPGNVPFALYEQLAGDPRYRAQVRLAVPVAAGDNYRGFRIVGTLPQLFGADDAGRPLPPERVLEYRPGRRYALAAGRVFAPDKFEAVIGAEAARRTGLRVGDHFHATHGLPEGGGEGHGHVHGEEWTVVGLLEPTGTAADRVLFIPLVSFYAIGEHQEGLAAQFTLRAGRPPATPAMPPPAAPPPATADDDHAHEEKHYTLDAEGRIVLELPREAWAVSAILVQARSQPMALGLIYAINNGTDAMAVNPALVMREFSERFLAGPSLVLLALAGLVTVVAAAGILIGIYNAVAARAREIAVLRALGATRATVLALYSVEALLIGAAGAAAGLLGGHLLAGAASAYLTVMVGEGIPWLAVAPVEWAYAVFVVVLAALAGLAPALKAYRTPVAENLGPA